MDVRVDCPRCGIFDIDYHAQVNLAGFAGPPNAATLSGISRHRFELDPYGTVPRLVWVEVDGDREGRYEFQGIPSERMSAAEKCDQLFHLFAKKVDRIPGEEVATELPRDLPLAFAKSPAEFDSYLKRLEKGGLIEFSAPSDSIRIVSLTVEGADYRQIPRNTASGNDEIELPVLAVEITGPKRGSGGFGQVYPGRQTLLARDVAVKVIQPETKPGAIDHAIALAKVTHPNVVHVLEVGRITDPDTENQVDCVVMEWVDGSELHEVWNELDENQAEKVCRQVVCAVQAMHDAGVCHHDLHAGNVMVNGTEVTVIDVHYTESARLSQISTAPKERLIADDWSYVARLIRNTLWNAKGDLLPTHLESRWPRAKSRADVEGLLAEVFEHAQAESAPSIQDAQDSSLANSDGLSSLDLDVLRAAGDMVAGNVDRRFVSSRVSVPKIMESLGNNPGVTESVRLLGELGYFHGTDRDYPRIVFMTRPGFRRYLNLFRPSYSQELQKLRVAIVRGEEATDLDFAIMTEIPRTIVEHALMEFAEEDLIQISTNNDHTRVRGVSTRMRRAAQDLG